MQLLCDALPIPAVWAGELIRHSNRQPVQSRDTAATFLVVCMVEWVGLGHNIYYIKSIANVETLKAYRK